jgi:hypothetical protein
VCGSLGLSWQPLTAGGRADCAGGKACPGERGAPDVVDQVVLNVLPLKRDRAVFQLHLPYVRPADALAALEHAVSPRTYDLSERVQVPTGSRGQTARVAPVPPVADPTVTGTGGLPSSDAAPHCKLPYITTHVAPAIVDLGSWSGGLEQAAPESSACPAAALRPPRSRDSS